MKKYSFANHDDETDKIVDTKEFESLLDAIMYFSTIKHLTPDEFLKLYKVFNKNEQ